MITEIIKRAIDGALVYAPAVVAENAITILVSIIVTLLTIFLTKLFSADPNEAEEEPVKELRSDQPRPKWEVLKVLNYVVVAVFVGSITFTLFNYRTYFGSDEDGSTTAQRIFPVLTLWCICMVYFFGFFGISFLDQNALARSPSSFGFEGLEGSAHVNPNSISLHDAPICVEKAFTQSKHAAGKHVQSTTPLRTLASLEGAAASAGSAPPAHSGQVLDFPSMTDEEVLASLLNGKIKDHELEKKLKDYQRAVRIRRTLFEMKINKPLTGLPLEGIDYEAIFGANCETVIGYLSVPVGVVGPFVIDGNPIYVPMATTEGCLVASTNRGCKAITLSGGARSVILKDGMTRAPLIQLPTAFLAAEMKSYVEDPENYVQLKTAFESTTSFGRLKSITSTVAGRNVFLRFVCNCGDAMGMNMISKGCLAVLEILQTKFEDMELISISGNMCTDKKPAAINWIEGRGKSVVVEAFIPSRIVTQVLKTSIKAIVKVNKQKNLVGSAMAGSIGGFNAHAANIVSAVFLATGQDIAQNVESSNCITLLEEVEGDLLHASVTMPSIEVGTVGGGTGLKAQAACLDIIGVKGPSEPPKAPGENAQQLARVVAATVLAGELSLLAALAANHLVRSHMQHNRKPKGTMSTE